MPTINQLDAAMLQSGRFVPAVQQTGGGTVTIAENGRPWRVVGNDAAIYQVTRPDGNVVALRCPFLDTFAVAAADVYASLARGGAVAVHAISDLLARPVAWKPEGLIVARDDLRTEASRVIVMEWIDGATLRETVDRALDRDDRQTLTSLADAWDSAIARLVEARFVHGDLSADNVLVDPDGRIRFVDFDTCSWPGSPPPPMLFGTPAYVHPRANADTTGANRDAFAALVIGVALRALALVDRRPAGRSSGGLLFSAWDLAHLGSSPVYAELRRAAPDILQDALNVLLRACEASPNDVLSQARQIPPTRDWAQHSRRPSLPRHDASARVRHRDVERFQERWKRDDRATAPFPGQGESAAHGRTADVQRLQDAMAAGDQDLVAALWPSLRDDPRLSSQSIKIADIVQRRHGKAIADAMRDGSDQRLVDSVLAAEAAGVAVTASTRRSVREARRRVALRERVRFAVERDDARMLAELTGSPEVDELQAEDAFPDIAGAARRAEQRARLKRALRVDDAAAIVAAWDPALLANDVQLGGEARQRIDQAIRGRRWLEDVRAALKARDASRLTELKAAATGSMLSQLSAVERKRVDRAVERAAARAHLERTLESGTREAVLNAMNRLMASGATLPESLDWAKVRDVADRESLVRAIRDASLSPRPDYERLALLLPAARAAAADSPFLDDDIDVEALERAVLREDYLRRLREAMASTDDQAIAAAAGPDPFGAWESLTPEERAHINAVLRRLGRRQLSAARV
ncbi:MAG: RIO1 family regulatory kinase/ATPase [Thermomicrobiales bacterium]